MCRSQRPWLRLHTHRAHCTNACLVFTRKEEGSHWTWAFPWDRAGPEEPEERKGRGPGWAAGCLPAATSPLAPGKGLLGRGAGRAGPLCQQRRTAEDTSPSHAPLTPTQLSRLCSRCILEGASVGETSKHFYRHWSDGASRPQEGRRRQVQDSARAGDRSLRTPHFSPPLWLLLPQSPFQNGREGRLQSLGGVG